MLGCVCIAGVGAIGCRFRRRNSGSTTVRKLMNSTMTNSGEVVVGGNLRHFQLMGGKSEFVDTFCQSVPSSDIRLHESVLFLLSARANPTRWVDALNAGEFSSPTICRQFFSYHKEM